MTERLAQTRDMLAKHHRDGERFAQLMRETFPERFNEAFWAAWVQWVEPVLSANPVVLDLGAGPGLFLQALARRYPGIRAIGVECAPYMLAAQNPLPAGCEVIAQDLHEPRLPLETGSVDAALASVVLHEMGQPVRLLLETARCLKPGGRLYLLDWVRAPLEAYIRHEGDEGRAFAGDTPADELEDLFTHFYEHNRFSREDLVYLLNKTGFAILDTGLLREGRYARMVAERRP